MDKRSGRDLLSDLPLSIIHSILTLVPIRDAVKTSILSRQWRYIWASLPYLVFNDECVSAFEEENVETRETKLKDFINQALLLHKGPIHMFKLHVPFVESCYINQWLLFLSRNDIRMLKLNVEMPNGLQIHSSLYSCRTLTDLELFNCQIPPPPPTFNGFLCLRSLALEYVEVPCKAIERIVANSPLLEEFTFILYSGSLEFRIHAPNLKYFKVKGYYGEIFLSAPLLSKISVAFRNSEFTTNKGVRNYTNFLGDFTNLEELSGEGYFIKYLSIGVESCHLSLVFHHLRVIELCHVNSHDIKEMRAVVRLITGAPNLHKLKITSRYKWQSPSEVVAGVSFWDSECAPNFTFERMKAIEMRNVLGGLHEMKLIKFLLESSPLLETVIFIPLPCLSDPKLLTLTAELLRYRRASANAEILFSKS